MSERESLEGIKSTSIALMGIQGLFLFAGIARLISTDDHVTEKLMWFLFLGGIIPMFMIYRKAMKGLKD